jgi:hypothetical protein
MLMMKKIVCVSREFYVSNGIACDSGGGIKLQKRKAIDAMMSPTHKQRNPGGSCSTNPASDNRLAQLNGCEEVCVCVRILFFLFSVMTRTYSQGVLHEISTARDKEIEEVVKRFPAPRQGWQSACE